MSRWRSSLALGRVGLGCGLLLLAAAHVHAQELASAEQELARGDYAVAEAALRALAAGSSSAADVAHVVLAKLLYETGRYGEAADTAQQVEHAPVLASAARTQHAEALEAVGKLDEAEALYRAALADPHALRARALLGRLLLARGRERAAKPFLDALIDAYNDDALGPDRAADLAYVAMAARALGALHDANDTFRESAEADHGRVETQLEWAELLLQKYDAKHAAESVLDALAHNKHSARAQTLMARITLSQTLDFTTAGEALDRALAVNPNFVAAHVARAGMALHTMELAQADAELERALAVNPNDLEALSVRAAVRFLADDHAGFARAKTAVLAQNPHFSRFYAIVAEYADWEHRYEDLVAMSRAALVLDKNDAVARATLGLNLLRIGEEPEGLTQLEAAFRLDPFNAQVWNTLNLYEKAIGPHYETWPLGPFRLRLHHDERAILEPYLVPLLQRAYADMQQRYAFTPEGPLSIELYADAQQFSVRTTGLPNVGVQGVCFGKVVTGLSPRGGPFNWGQIVWHELSHVFHLQLSKNHVPRWFTEGLAEYETTIARPEWKREDDHALWQALHAGTLPALFDFNRAFTHARKPEDLTVAYYAAYKTVAYIVGRFGFARVRPMLVQWGEGKATAEIVQSVLGVSIDQLDRDFRARIKTELARYDAEFQVDFSAYADVPALSRASDTAPQSADAWAALAMGLVLHDQFALAEPAAQHALALAPKHELAHFALARIALQQQKLRKAERCLRRIVDGGHDGYVLRMMLARAALTRDDPAEAHLQLEAAIKLDPERQDAWKALLAVAERLHDTALAGRVLGQIAALDQHDHTLHEAYTLLLAQQQRWPEVVREGESALYVATASAGLHHALGRAYVETGDPKRGLVELDRALMLGPARPAEIQHARAHALTLLGDAQAAQAAEANARTLEGTPWLSTAPAPP